MFEHHQEDDNIPSMPGLASRLADRLGRGKRTEPEVNGDALPAGEKLAGIEERQRAIQEQILNEKVANGGPKNGADRISSTLAAAAYGSFLMDSPSRAPSFGASLAAHCSIVVLYLVLAPYMPRFQPAQIEPTPDDSIEEKLVIRIPSSLFVKPSQLQALNAPPAPTVQGGGGSGHEGGSPAPANTAPKLTAEPAPAPKAETAAEPAPKAPEPAKPAPEPPAPPARFEMKVQAPRVPGKQTLLQTGSAPTVPIQEDVQLPNIMFSSANAQEVRKPIAQRYVMPGRKVVDAPRVAQSLQPAAPPELELAPKPTDQMGIATQPTLAAVPKPIPQKFNLPTHRQPPPPGNAAALSASDGESIRLLSLSNQPAPVSEFLVIPGGNQIGDIVPDTSGGTSFGTGSVGGTEKGTGRTAAGDTKGTAGGRGTAAGGSPQGTENGSGRGGAGTGGGTGAGGTGTGLGAGTGDGNGRGTGTGPGRGSGTGTSLASGSGPGSGPGTGGGNGGGGDDPAGGITVFGGEVPGGGKKGGTVQLPGEVATQMARPQLGTYDVVVVQTSAADALPESAGMLSGQPIYTVYLEIGLSKDWILQYCISAVNGGARQDETIVSLGNPAPVKAPFPMRTRVPEELNDHRTGLIMLHGFLDARGRFKSLEWVTGGSNYLGQILIAALKDWEFRPATRDGRAVEVEVILAIPAKEA